MKSTALGVVVVRIQVPNLHSGHHYLLQSVSAIHQKVLVVIGESEATFTAKDPLTFQIRASMVKSVYPNVIVNSIKDMPDDAAWSQSLDGIISRTCKDLGFDEVVLYGGRDSFLKHYSGTYRSFELPSVQAVSGTDVREAVEVRDNEAFREGVIYATTHRYPTSYQTVDIAPLRGSTVLLGRKARDGGKWRFIGGFVQPGDHSLEHAAWRELSEEAGLSLRDFRYLGSMQIDDFRYPKGGKDAVMTAFFSVDAVDGEAVAGDDIEEVRWFELTELTNVIAKEHYLLATGLLLSVGIGKED